MGVLEHVSGLEEIVSGSEGEEKPQSKQKPKKQEDARPDARTDSRLGKIEESVRSLEEAVEDVRNSMPQASAEAQPQSDIAEKLQSDMEALQETVNSLGKEKAGSGESGIRDILQRLDEIESRAPAPQKDYSAEIEGLESARRIAEKNFMEMKSRMDVLQKYVDGKITEFKAAADGMLRKISAGDRNKDMESLRKSINEILEKKQNEILSKADEIISDRLKDSMQHSINGFKSGINRHIGDVCKKIEEDAEKAGKRQEEIERLSYERLNGFEEKLGAFGRQSEERMNGKLKDVFKKMEEFSRNCDEKIGNMKGESESLAVESLRKINMTQKSIGEMESRIAGVLKMMDSFKGGIDSAVSEALKSVPKRDDLRKDMDEKINGKLTEFSKKVEALSRYDLDRLKSVVDAEKSIDEKMKLFALNSDVEKVWKETESLKRYVDEKNRVADGLANSLRIWENRNMQLMEKEHDFDEKMGAFPELKLMESRIKKIERALAELQKHFVAAQITEPIIME